MPRIPFDELPESARVWIFAADRALAEGEERRLLDAVDAFLEGWKAHGTPLRGGRRWRDGRFLVVGVDEDAAPPSGCSIDALVRVLKEEERELDISLLDHGRVFYREGGEIRRASRAEFRRLAEEGRVGPETAVFDTSIVRMERLRDGAFETPARESWHGRAFFGEPARG